MPEKRGHDEVVDCMYNYRFSIDTSRDLCVYEIQRDCEGEAPYTVIVPNFREKGHKQLFSDIFWCDSWDLGRGNNGPSSDVKFLICLWRELGLVEEMGEEFQPKHVVHDLDRYPHVYRRSLESVMNQRFGNVKV